MIVFIYFLFRFLAFYLGLGFLVIMSGHLQFAHYSSAIFFFCLTLLNVWASGSHYLQGRGLEIQIIIILGAWAGVLSAFDCCSSRLCILCILNRRTSFI